MWATLTIGLGSVMSGQSAGGATEDLDEQRLLAGPLLVGSWRYEVAVEQLTTTDTDSALVGALVQELRAARRGTRLPSWDQLDATFGALAETHAPAVSTYHVRSRPGLAVQARWVRGALHVEMTRDDELCAQYSGRTHDVTARGGCARRFDVPGLLRILSALGAIPGPRPEPTWPAPGTLRWSHRSADRTWFAELRPVGGGELGLHALYSGSERGEYLLVFSQPTPLAPGPLSAASLRVDDRGRATLYRLGFDRFDVATDEAFRLCPRPAGLDEAAGLELRPFAACFSDRAPHEILERLEGATTVTASDATTTGGLLPWGRAVSFGLGAALIAFGGIVRQRRRAHDADDASGSWCHE